VTGPNKVAYLIGAGGSHACIKAVGSSRGILMTDLATELVQAVRDLVLTDPEFSSLLGVVNEVVDERADFEHLITFFDESPAAAHRRFAEELRRIFEEVLRSKLVAIESELGQARVSLYSALLDMYNVQGLNESLNGILTLNYDDYIEDAVREIYGDADDHVSARAPNLGTGSVNGWAFLKLHGSFGWQDSWPIAGRAISSDSRPLWIPPGIKKGKERYPFNFVWGLARDVLNCDVLRVIGCRLGPSDWDLISLLFGTRHADTGRSRPYTIEIIDSPAQADSLKNSYPYLDVQSIFEIETLDVGRNLVSDFLGGLPRRLDALSRDERERLLRLALSRNENWFRTWLIKMGEGLQYDLGVEATDTPKGAFRHWLEI